MKTPEAANDANANVHEAFRQLLNDYTGASAAIERARSCIYHLWILCSDGKERCAECGEPRT